MNDFYTNTQKIKISLSAKFISMMICILSVTMGMSAYFSYGENKKLAEDNLVKQAKANSEFLAKVSQEAILTHDYITLDNYTSSISLVEDIAYGIILSKKGLPLSFHLNKDNKNVNMAAKKIGFNEILKIIQDINKSENISRAIFPVKLGDEKIAEIVIGIDKSRLFSLAKKDVVNQLKINAFIIFVLSIFIYIIFKYNALEPIRELIKGAERIANGDLDKKVLVDSSDEIGILASAFNCMMLRLNKSIKSNDDSIDKLTFLNKTLELRIKERTDRLELAQRIAHMGHWDITGSNDEINTSSEVFNILGMKNDEHISLRKFIKLVKRNQRRMLFELYKEAILNHKAFETEFQIIRNDNSKRYVSVIAEVEMDENYGVVLLGVIQDLTERKESEIAQHNVLLEKLDAEIANEAKSAFLANMSHEIRTPLTAIIGFSEEMLSRKSYDQDKNEIETILRNGKHLLSVINEILDLSKIESQKLEIEIIKTNLFQVVDEVSQVMKLQASAKGLAYSVNYNYPTPAFIQTDPTRLKQVLLNICSNAIKFTDKGFVKIDVSYDVIDKSINIVVTDSGIGITTEQLKQLFQPFSQADSTTTRKYGGTGLGLYISRELVRRMGGDIYIESLPTIGTKLSFNISSGEINSDDMVSNDSDLNRDEDKEIQLGEIPVLSGNILLAEDSDDNQALFTLYIKAAGANVDIAADGVEAIKMAQQSTYDLILMDIQMPHMDGLQATKHIISQGNTTPIVAITANAMREDRYNCEQAGCVDFLSKPINKAEFYKILSRYLKASLISKNYDTPNLEQSILDNSSQQHNNEIDTELEAVKVKFVNSLEEKTNLLTDASNQYNWGEFKAIIHKLKGSGTSFGFVNITRQCEKLEELIRNDDFEGLPLELDALIKMCEYAREYV